MKILYITQKIPYGKAETFIIPEIKEVLRKGYKVIIFPIRPDKKIYHKEAYQLIPYTHRMPLLHSKIIFLALKEFFSKPSTVFRLLINVLRNSRSLKIFLKNLMVFPKALYGAYVFRQREIYHIHAHWASTTSSVAYIMSKLLLCPWSFTAHRWDISENNMLQLKVRDAQFVRCISKDGAEELIKMVHIHISQKVKIIHMGVYPSNVTNVIEEKKPIVFLTPANFVPVKGHLYLLEACKLLINKRLDFKIYFAGDGPLRPLLMERVKELGLEDNVIFLGQLSQDELLNLYKNHKVDIVVLPSIVTENGEKEGIPVSLMEAMSFKVPVISTDTGGINELLRDGAGIVVSPKNAEELAEAMVLLAINLPERKKLSEAGYKRVYEEFNIEKETEKLLKEMHP